MTVTDQIKILNRKIKQNESQYDLDREAAKISARSSNNLDKYELLIFINHYKKLNSLIDLKPRSRENKIRRLEVIIRAGDIYNKLYNIYRSKYNKKIDSLSAKNKKSLITNN